jgi:hypothetical protein
MSTIYFEYLRNYATIIQFRSCFINHLIRIAKIVLLKNLRLNSGYKKESRAQFNYLVNLCTTSYFVASDLVFSA